MKQHTKKFIFSLRKHLAMQMQPN